MIDTALPVAAGVFLIAFMLRDIFHTLFHPSSQGPVSSRGIRALWSLFRRITRGAPRHLSLAGPLSLLMIIALWTGAIAIGWALIIWPFLPEGFLLSTGMLPVDNRSFSDAMYISTVTLTTLGYGDITPTSTWLRLVSPLEAVIGFSLITAAISWILSVTPVLSRRRNLAREVALLHKEGRWKAALDDDSNGTMLIGVLQSLTEQVLSARSDYEYTPITYYFRQTDRDAAPDVAYPRLAVIAEQAEQHPLPAVRVQAELLRVALHDLMRYVGTTFLDMPEAGIEDILMAFSEDQLREGPPETHEAAEILA